MSAEEIEGTVVEEQHPQAEQSQDLVRTRPVTLTVTPQIKAAELVERLDMIREASERAMVEGVDYGKVPGTDKPTLLKPGAEKLGVLFQLDIQIDNAKTWGPGDHLTVVARAVAYHAPTGARLGYGEGICTTREKKYAYRKLERTCPDCRKANIRRSKNESEGWYCWRKTDGCGATFAADDERIVSQEVGQIDNPDLPDVWNTVVKMAEKRARVDVVLAVTGASALFTQDLDDNIEADTRPPAQANSNGGSRVTARPAQTTERTATAKQRGLIHARAGEKSLSPATLANIVLAAAEQEQRQFESQSVAEDWLKRQLERLPGRLVNKVLAGIKAAESEES